MATITNLTYKDRNAIVNALYAQAERLNNTFNDKKADPSVRAISKVAADETISLASRLKNATSFQYTTQ